MGTSFEFAYFLSLKDQFPDYFKFIKPETGFDLEESRFLFDFSMLFNTQIL